LRHGKNKENLRRGKTRKTSGKQRQKEERRVAKEEGLAVQLAQDFESSEKEARMRDGRLGQWVDGPPADWLDDRSPAEARRWSSLSESWTWAEETNRIGSDRSELNGRLKTT
jgi:hypothetical protein